MKYTQKEWLEELNRRFGEDMMKWAFKCPACGKVSTVQEFKDAGAEPNDSYQACIGRYTGKGAPTKDSQEGCNWAAFGLFKTLGRGDVIVTDKGEEVNIFSMAENTIG